MSTLRHPADQALLQEFLCIRMSPQGMSDENAAPVKASHCLITRSNASSQELAAFCAAWGAALAGALEDTMESFFLSETIKYLCLLHSNATALPDYFVFSTEGHLLPVLPSVADAEAAKRLQSRMDGVCEAKEKTKVVKAAVADGGEWELDGAEEEEESGNPAPGLAPGNKMKNS